MNFFLGLDAGGTKTSAVIMDETSKIIAQASGGPANYFNIGLSQVKRNIFRTIEEVFSKAFIQPDKISWCVIGIASCNTSKDYHRLFEALTAKEMHNFADKLTLVNDTVIGLYSGILPPGLVVISGTGSNVYGINAHGEEAIAGNWGYFLGDKGSGYILGQHLFKVVVSAYDQVGKLTNLADKLKQKISVQTSAEIYDWFYENKPGIRQISDFAPLVIEAAEEGDEVAKKLVDDSIKEIGKALMAVVHRLKLENEYNRIVTVGGLFESKYFRGMFEGHVTALLKRVRVVKPLVTPAVGAAIMAKQEWEKTRNLKNSITKTPPANHQ